LQAHHEGDAARDAQARAHEADQGRLREQRAEDLPGGGTDGAKEGELTLPLPDEHRERVEDEEGPHEQGDQREHQDDRLHEPERLLGGGALFLADLLAGHHLDAVAERGLHVHGHLFRVRPLLGHSGHLGDGAVGREGLARDVLRDHQDRGAEQGNGVLHLADDRHVHRRELAGAHLGGVADLVPGLLESGGVERDLALARGEPPVEGGRKAQFLPQRPAERRRLRVGHGEPVRPHHVRDAEQLRLGGGDAVDLRDLLGERDVEEVPGRAEGATPGAAPTAVVGGALRLETADVDVRGGHGGVQLVDRVAEEAGEGEGPRHERGGEEDGEDREDEPHPVRADVPQGEAQHQRTSAGARSARAASTESWVGSRSSCTMRPSARKRIRSA